MSLDALLAQGVDRSREDRATEPLLSMAEKTVESVAVRSAIQQRFAHTDQILRVPCLGELQFVRIRPAREDYLEDCEA
jgi:hypothetical protein